ncbi:hypothetical protein PF008_g19763 [Phytophthora fragariae]|uniref:Uncharacterized protein n=1 Tax=Phytophthora fragariae TaxID=53985 RepID=A0A6G0R1F7_9STRA|nr:hypothetical protein PF008_g19763 [Phytophthora fragariae]
MSAVSPGIASRALPAAGVAAARVIVIRAVSLSSAARWASCCSGRAWCRRYSRYFRSTLPRRFFRLTLACRHSPPPVVVVADACPTL